jgi:hypothetical protein
MISHWQATCQNGSNLEDNPGVVGQEPTSLVSICLFLSSRSWRAVEFCVSREMGEAFKVMALGRHSLNTLGVLFNRDP